MRVFNLLRATFLEKKGARYEDESGQVDFSLAPEIQTFERKLHEWLAQHKGEFALVKGDQVIGFFPDHSSALNKGYESFGTEQPFLVKQIEEESYSPEPQLKLVGA